MNKNIEKEVDKVIQFVKDYYKKHNLKGAVLGISGGKDSAVVAAILTKALGSENVIGLTLPCHSKKDDTTDAKLVSDFYGFPLYDFELTPIFDMFKKQAIQIFHNSNENHFKDSDINLKPRLRMTTLYYVASLLSSINNQTYLVAGTTNKCELFVGYFTKGADNVHDIATISDFTVEEVIQIGEYLKVPKKVLYKTPSDGLSDMTDEEKLGVSYNDIALFMKDSEQIIDKHARDKIENMHTSTRHKFKIPTYKKEKS